MKLDLWIVTFDDGGNPNWEAVLAYDYDDAINQAKIQIKDIYDHWTDEEFESQYTFFEAYNQCGDGERDGKKYKVVVEEVK